MKTYNIIKGIFAATVLSVVFSGCSEDAMDRINKDHGHTQSVAARFILTDVITSTAFSNAGGDFNTYLSAYIEYEVGVDNQLYYAETRESEPTSSSTFNTNIRCSASFTTRTSTVIRLFSGVYFMALDSKLCNILSSLSKST